LRQVPHVPDILGPAIPKLVNDAPQCTNWYRAMLILFKPWQNLRDLIQSTQSWREAYNTLTVSVVHQTIMCNMDMMNQAKE
ncbi:hypothetical protein CALCODRAFT_408552, partial [Calocera cornea HHB12733]